MGSAIYAYGCDACGRVFLIDRFLEDAPNLAAPERTPCPSCHVVGEVTFRGQVAIAYADSP